MLRLRDFELLTPRTPEEAISMLRGEKNALVVAGGTDLIPKMKRGQFEPDVLVSFARIEGLDFIEVDDGVLRIGAATTLRALEESGAIRPFECIGRALGQLATPTIRNSATVAGNLLQDTRCRYYDRSLFWRDAVGYCIKKGGDDCKVAPGADHCFATLCSDLAPVFVALDAQVEVLGKRRRTIALEDLYSGDGAAHLKINREIVTEVRIPLKECLSTYEKLRLRGGFDFPEIGVATVLRVDGDEVQAHVAMSGISSSIFSVKENVPRDGLRDLAERVYKAIKPMDTLYVPPAYRKNVARNLLLKSLDELLPA